MQEIYPLGQSTKAQDTNVYVFLVAIFLILFWVSFITTLGAIHTPTVNNVLVAFVVDGLTIFIFCAFVGAILQPKSVKVVIDGTSLKYMYRKLYGEWQIYKKINLDSTSEITFTTQSIPSKAYFGNKRPQPYYQLTFTSKDNSSEKFRVVGWDNTTIQPVFEAIRQKFPKINFKKSQETTDR